MDGALEEDHAAKEASLTEEEAVEHTKTEDSMEQQSEPMEPEVVVGASSEAVDAESSEATGQPLMEESQSAAALNMVEAPEPTTVSPVPTAEHDEGASAAPSTQTDETHDDAGGRSTPPLIHMQRSSLEDAASEPQSSTDHPPAGPSIPDNVLEQYSRQMQRLEENFQQERAEMERQHAAELAQLKASFTHDACEAARHELQESLQKQIGEKDDQLHELMRINEGMKLKMDVYKREVTGMQQLLEARDSDLGQASEQHSRGLQALEQKLLQTEELKAKFEKDATELQAKLDSKLSEFEYLKKDHADLKTRVKAVATELKERRVECRELHAQLEEKDAASAQLREQIENLNVHLAQLDRHGTDKEEEMEQLRAQLVDAKLDLEKAEKVRQEQAAKAEKVLVDYKRKAQNSLSMANSRAATAIQAKEEAEMEARAARQTADSAMDKAVRAELSSKEAVAEARAYVKDMEKEKAQAVKDMQEATEKLAAVEARLGDVENQLAQSTAAHEKASGDLKGTKASLREAQGNIARLEDELAHSQSLANRLRNDVATLREQLQRAEAKVREAEEKEESEHDASKPDKATREELAGRPTRDAAIRILQEELREANNTIAELKQALANAVEQNDKNGLPPRTGQDGSVGAASPNYATNGDSSSTPLFYAMEKQAELNTARDEITRLANLLSSVQSERMEAVESMELMRKRMEESEARLMRFEKLGAAGDTRVSSTAVNGGEKASGAVNIEYLKNIVLRYLNAKTLAEKKALVPVIGAVLCLTPDEQQAAINALEHSGSLGGVGTSLFESLSSKLI